MSFTDKLIDDFNKDTDEVETKNEPTKEWSKEAPAEWSKPGEPITTKEDDKPADKVEEQPKEEPTEEQPKEEPQPKPDLSKLTKEQKAEHAFQKQLAKQKAKYESSIDEIKKQFQSQIEDVKKQLEAKKAEEPVKRRDDFETDDEYIGYLTQRGVDQRMAQIDADNAKARAEQEAKDKAEAEAAEQQKQVAEYFNTNARNTFGDQYDEFEKTVQKGVANGLADVLDEAPAVRDYIFSNPNGPAVLNEMLQNKDSFVRVMRLAANPMDAVIECHELARELSTRKAEPAPAPAPKMPSIGKPGAGGSTRTAPDMYGDDQSLIDFVRKHR